jgi:hypothetical protein
MGEQDEIPRRRRDNKVYGSLWLQSGADPQPSWSVPTWMWAAVLFMNLVMAVGFFGLVFLGWGGTSGVGP